MNTTYDVGVPLIDIAPLIQRTAGQMHIAEKIGQACRDHGFFYITGHGVSEALQAELETLSAAFFALPPEEKMKIRMDLGGRAWRGYFPVGDELTSGKPDLKEGLYFGQELAGDHPLVRAKTPMHGRNLFPAEPAGLRRVVLAYMEQLTELGHHLMRALSLSLNLPEDFFREHYTAEPLTLFRIFHYPAQQAYADLQAPWGVGEHTDYGVLTILKQDQVGGLQIKTGTQWIDAPYIAGTFVCNIGDMLDRMTNGRYRSTPHRVRNVSGRSRYSFPFFFDPNFEAKVKPLPASDAADPESEKTERWDGADLSALEGTYGQYIMNKVAKVFPQLRRTVED